VLPRLRRIDVHRYSSDDARALQAARPDIDIDDHQGKLWDPTAEELAALHAFWRDRGRLGRAWRKALEKLLDSDADADRPTDEQLIEMVTKESLYFWKLGLTSAAPLAHFRWATKLTLSENRIEDLAPLAGMTRLENLIAQDNSIDSLAPLAGLTLLEELDVTRNRLDGLTGVPQMRELRELRIDGNQIESLAEVAGMTKLRYLAAVENRIGDLAPLAGLTRLRSLYVYGNRIHDLAPLAGCEELEVVECFANPGITGLMALVQLRRLKTVLSHSGLPAEEIAAFRKARPDVRVD
jgi:hypothetical protein